MDDRTADGVDNIKVWQDGVLIYPVNYVAQIGETKYETLAAAVAAANAGDVIKVIKAGDYTLPNLSENVTVEGAVDGVVFTHTTAGNVASIPNGASFKNVKFVFGNVNYHGFQHASTINMENCTLDGKFFSYGDMNFINCKFTQSASDYHMWCYSGNVTYTGCTFTANGTGKFLNIYNEDGTTKYTVTVENCKFVNNVAANKAALNVKATCKGELLQFDVIVKNCTTEGSFPAESTSQALVVLNNVVQVDDRTADGVDNIKVWQDGVLIYPVNYVAQIGDVKYETLQAALDAAEAADTENFVIELLADAELDITAWDGTKNPLSIGTENTQSITINGNNHKLTFNQKNSDWNNVATMNDAQTKLVLNDMTISSTGYNNGPWNRHDINFNCAVELNNVTSDKALAFKNDATLKNVTITDNSGDIYAVWISPRGQKVDIDGLTINCGRGIKIDDEYSKTPYDATLNIANATFNTTKKSAILVKNNGETTINAGEGINIEHAAADTVNPIWVDEDKAEEFYKLTVTGANVVPEKKESDYVVCLMKGEQRWGYYKGTNALSRTIAQVEEGWSIKLHQTTTEAVEVSKPLVITKNGFTADNVTAGEGFVREETDDEIIIKEKAEEVLVELIHGVPYPYPEGKECTKVTYKRTFASDVVDHYRSWYVPFDYTVSEEDLEKFKFYKIHMIAGSDQAGEVSDVSNINIFITKVEAGTKLVHNKPYVIVSKEELTDHVFTAENVDKVYAEENGSRLHVETAEFNYDFYGTYREYRATKPSDWYALNKNGAISPNNTNAAKLQSYVWVLKVTPRNDGEDYSNISFSFVEGDDTNQIMNYTISEDNEIEGIYTVNGMKVDEPVKGVNIIRFMDGKTKKIYVK